MRLNEYQKKASSFANDDLPLKTAMAVWALGLTGEAGEVADIIKKHLGHGHPLPVEEVAKELGDVLWYVAKLAEYLDFTLEEVAELNLKKLQARYGSDGFSTEKSMKRNS